ncbi:MAG: diaminopimelate decarboxylase [Paludibacterium sp.]|uniref:diaminopimelate decarboxylase n=1 Tax=Paludibacterium sp. TaxID=1917523 RepID=UPI0025F524FA|nr:diaminopimelate decarboxylase [Paludibacterium sp.]MBV8046503.1 diaminopimelate decarboxylase [Paludibacterium sp.]MBV8648005.1 diaminopimelate decarboxylase [Paludibacterium sp.]
MKPTHYRENDLYIEDLPLADIAAQYGTPAYVYSQDALTAAYDDYRAAFAELDPLLCYAVKANSNLSILRHFAHLGAGFDIVSGGELARVLAAGADAGKVVFSGVGKSESEMLAALDAGIKCFNVESLNELLKLNAVAGLAGKVAPISLRVNPDVDAQTHPYISTGLKDNKFGIAYDAALAIYQQAQSLPNLRIIGIDCHIGSQLTDAAPLIDALDRLLALIDQLAKAGITLHHLDIGGGLGIRYRDETPPDLAAFSTALAERLQGRALQLVMEPGRSLVGNAGILLTKVEYLKLGEHKNFAVVDAAMNDLMRPSLYSAYHSILPVKRHAHLVPVTVDVVGPICESSDFLGKDRQLAVAEGELLAIMSCGAYGSTMASNYNTRTRAAEIMVSGGDSRVIRQRETLEQLLANEKACLD